MTFVPGSVNGSAPYGRWTVVGAFADPAWLYDRDTMRDLAVLRVAPQTIGGLLRRVEQLTGGNRLVVTPPTIGPLEVPAYPAGAGGRPIMCLAAGYRTGAYSSFNCQGYAAGTSGAPFLQGPNLLGVLGGLHQGGCFSFTSYAAPFDARTEVTLDRAMYGGRGDVLPLAGPDGC
jgi:hypothetical protein